MKKIITWLIRKDDPDVMPTAYQWWWLEETKYGDPPEERAGMYTWPQVLQALRSKLAKYKE